MKRIYAICTALIFLLCGCTQQKNIQHATVTDKISAVWIYYDELSMKNENGGTEESFKAKAEEMLDKCQTNGINTAFIHVRPFCDAFYESKYFPWSEYITGKQGRNPQYDPLKIILKEAHKRGIKVHAWLNPFRISFSNNISKLDTSNPALNLINQKSNDVVEVDGGLYFSPPSQKAQNLVIDGVREIVENYDVDGIHIDDYFYPSTEKKVDKCFYDEYKKNGGKLNLSDWRLSIISAFVSSIYNTVKSVDSECVFSISPAGNIKNNYNSQFADVKLWCSESGYADWIIPQLYYGFENKTLPFDKACKQWSEISVSPDVKVIIGIGAYRVNNKADTEWKNGNGIISKQISCAENYGFNDGFAFFSYSSIFENGYDDEFSFLGSKTASENIAYTGSGNTKEKPKDSE